MAGTPIPPRPAPRPRADPAFRGLRTWPPPQVYTRLLRAIVRGARAGQRCPHPGGAARGASAVYPAGGRNKAAALSGGGLGRGLARGQAGGAGGRGRAAAGGGAGLGPPPARDAMTCQTLAARATRLRPQVPEGASEPLPGGGRRQEEKDPESSLGRRTLPGVERGLRPAFGVNPLCYRACGFPICSFIFVFTFFPSITVLFCAEITS